MYITSIAASGSGCEDAATQHVSCHVPAVCFELVHARACTTTRQEFFRNKQECYSRFGSQAAVNYGKQADTGLHLVIARDVSGHQIGGVAIYDRCDGGSLPLEIAIGHEPCVRAEIETWSEQRSVVEFSGFWIGESWRKSGLSRELVLVAMAGAHHLRATRIVGFSHDHVTDFYSTVGMLPHPSADRFYYPHPPYVSLMIWGDPVLFSTVPEAARAEVWAYVTAIRDQVPFGWTP